MRGLLLLEPAWLSLKQLVCTTVWDHEVRSCRVEVVHEVMRLLLIFEVLLQSFKFIMMFWVEVRILLPEFNAIIPGKIYGRGLHLHYA